MYSDGRRAGFIECSLFVVDSCLAGQNMLVKVKKTMMLHVSAVVPSNAATGHHLSHVLYRQYMC